MEFTTHALMVPVELVTRLPMMLLWVVATTLTSFMVFMQMVLVEVMLMLAKSIVGLRKQNNKTGDISEAGAVHHTHSTSQCREHPDSDPKEETSMPSLD